MNNINFLSKILMSDAEYWIAERRMEFNNHMGRTTDVEILFFCVPIEFEKGMKYEEIKLKDIENLQRAYVQNVFITNTYAPFQSGISLYDVVDGFPVCRNQKEFLIKALSLKSKNIYDYQKLIEEVSEPG